jgi:hypothetical protein
MIAVAAIGLAAAAFFAAVAKRGWPTVTIGDAVTAGEPQPDVEPEPVERTAAIGFALPTPVDDDWDDE